MSPSAVAARTCYAIGVSARFVALVIGAVLVLGLGVYLRLAVSAPPERATASVEPRVAEPATEHAAAPRPPSVTLRQRPHAGSAAPAVEPPVAAPTGSTPAPTAATPAEDQPSPAKLDALMSEANKAYDRGDLEDARTIAQRMLALQPDNVRMLRILVSASCMEGDAAAAQASYRKLPPGDQAQMRTRCSRYGVSLSDTP